jgi:hypothetical protein
MIGVLALGADIAAGGTKLLNIEAAGVEALKLQIYGLGLGGMWATAQSAAKISGGRRLEGVHHIAATHFLQKQARPGTCSRESQEQFG